LLSKKSRVYLFDSVLVKGKRGGWKKGADVHWLSIENEIVSLDGVCEVKSYLPSSEKLDNQINKHIIRFRRGCLINGKSYGEAFVKKQQTVKISVIPAKWKLSRKFEFEKRGEKNYFIPDEKLPDLPSEIISQIKTFNYQIIIPWSYEALAAEAYKLTLWLMYELGKIAYDKGVPNEWKEMTPGKAGQNAAELMLYYAIGRCNTGSKSEQRAIALYNTYGFGYSIGMNFLDSKGKRKMLWYKDLQEIKQNGKTMDGFSIKI